MDISGTDAVSQTYAVRVDKIAQNVAKTEGEGALQLIEGAKPPPQGANGEGTHVNTYA
jgi:hypothetical protein